MPDAQPEHTIVVKADPSLHPGLEAAGEVDRLTFAVLDTTYNLLREYAVRVTLAAIRESNPGLPSDEELFKESAATGDPLAPKEHMDLAPDDTSVAATIALAFNHLATLAMQEAAEGMGFQIAEEK